MMKKMSRILALVLALTLAVSVALADGLKIGIISLVENGAFLDMKTGIIEGLAAAGYSEATDAIDYQCAQGDATSLSTIANKMDGYDLVFTIATPPAQQFVNLESDTPLFFCSVSAPVAAGIISDMATPDKNATGTSNAIPVDSIFALADTLTPGITKWGLIYSTKETNAVNTCTSCMAYLEAHDIPYKAVTIETSNDVMTATQSLVDDGCTAIFVPNDSNVQAGVASLAEICAENKIPTYASSATTVLSGCLATVAIDDVGIGSKTVDLALAYLNGTPIEEIPAIVVPADYVSVNTETLAALGIDLAGASTLTVGETVYDVHYLSK